MSDRLKPTWRALRYCGDCVVLLGCWVLWLGLGGLLAVQVAVIVAKEFTVPDFLLRSIEERFVASGFNARFGRATFDIAGGVLLENVRLSLPEFPEPVAEARALFVELEPWALLAGNIEARRLHATGTRLFVPAMLAPSGRREEVLRDLDCSIALGEAEFTLHYLHAQLAGLPVFAHGTCALPRTSTERKMASVPYLEKLAQNYAALSRQLIRVSEQLHPLQQPILEVELSATPTSGAIAAVTLSAREFSAPAFHQLTLRDIRAHTRVPLLGDVPAMPPLHVSVAELGFAEGVAKSVDAELRGVFVPARFTFDPREMSLTAREVAVRGFSLEDVIARIEPRQLPALAGDVIARNFGSPLAVSGTADLSSRTAELEITGALSPQLLQPISTILGRDLRRYINFGQPVEFTGRATFLPGWKFEQLAGRIAAREIDAYHVGLDSARGDIEFDGRHFMARRASARLGANFATGSFEQDLKTREFRFLLEGRLRPLDISGWFREWWPNFFRSFEFPVAPPNASVDVAGRWFAGRETTVFVFAEASGASIREAKFDYARTLMFIRPNFFDGLELFGIRGTGDLRGTFTRTIETESYDAKELTFAFDSSLDLETGAKLLGPSLGARVAPYTFERPPRLRVAGRIDGPAAPAGEHHELTIEAQSNGGFAVFGFPGTNLSFDAKLHDGDLTLENVSADVAAGILTGRAKIWGPDSDRRLGFDASLRSANLGQAATAVSRYLALRRGQTEQPGGGAVLASQNTTQFDLSLSAEGLFRDPFSYRGSGNASFAGPELGQIRLLGLLSELLNFTALRFTNAQTDFRIEGPKVTFRAVNVTGANSAIQAHGDYSLKTDALDFNARVYPFQESQSLLESVVGVMLLPFSAVLEVRLTGPLREPNWAFVIGPTNFLRSLSEPASAPETSPEGLEARPEPASAVETR